MNVAKLVDIARLEATYDLQIDNEVLPDNLKCVSCKSILRDACQGPCGCRLCRKCINEIVGNEDAFCPGSLEECGESLLSQFLTDYGAINRISKLMVQCPKNGCMHKAHLISIEDHMLICPRRSVDCPFRDLGCLQDQLAADEMNYHFQQDSCSHSEILIGLIANINTEIKMIKEEEQCNKKELEALKQTEEDSKREIWAVKENEENNKQEIKILKENQLTNKSEIDILRETEENNSNEIEDLKDTEDEFKSEIALLKQQLIGKDESIRTTVDRLVHVENENKSIKAENAKLSKRIDNILEILNKKFDERLADDKLESSRITKRVDKKITAFAEVMDSQKLNLEKLMKAAKADIQSLHQNVVSINNAVQSLQSKVILVQVPAISEIDCGDQTGKDPNGTGIKNVVKTTNPAAYRPALFARKSSNIDKGVIKYPSDLMTDKLERFKLAN